VTASVRAADWFEQLRTEEEAEVARPRHAAPGTARRSNRGGRHRLVKLQAEPADQLEFAAV